MAASSSQACHRVVLATSATLIAACPLILTDARAQDGRIEGEEVEEIIVTGSRIKRRDFSSPSPIQTIDRDTLQFSGQPTLEEALNQMPQMMPDFGRTSNNPGDGTARINLRGLGAARTLVLLNGRRIAPSGTGSTVDVNILPQTLVDRVEIITGGASTVYGSDAMAGVVNFITRDDYDGLSAEVSYSITEKGDAGVADLSVAYGHNLASGRGNITIFANALDREPLFAGERALTSVALGEDGQGGLIQRGSFSTPASVIFTPVNDDGENIFYTFEPDGTPRPSIDPDDRYNFQPVNYLQIPLMRIAGGVLANFEISDTLETYVELNLTRNRSKLNLAPVPTAGLQISINVDNPILTPEARQIFADNFITDPTQPNLASFAIGKRMVEVGPRISDIVRDYSRLILGLRGALSRNWDLDAWLGYTDVSEELESLNGVSRSRLAQGLLVDPATGQCFDPGGGCVPVNIFGENSMSGAAADFLRINNIVNTSGRTQELASVVLTGPLFRTWAGTIDTAFGVEWRSDDGQFAADDALFTGDAIGLRGAAAVNGSEDVWEVYGEAIVPLAQDVAWADLLNLEIGARYSDYKNAGGVWTYKIGGEWEPFAGLRFRGMRQRSVRAPNIAELFEEQFSEVEGFVGSIVAEDPCSASSDPVGNGFTDKCVIQGLDEGEVGVWEATPLYPTEFIQGGNENLTPEEAETWTLGAVLNPDSLPNWHVSVDYFELEVTDTIGRIDPVLICFDALNAENLFCDKITRDATGNVSQVLRLIENRGLLRTTGFDTQIQYQTDLPDVLAIDDSLAQMTIRTVWTHMRDNDMQENPVTTVFECAGHFGSPCFDGEIFTGGQTFAENRVTTNANYLSGPVTVHLTWRWIQGTDNAAFLAAEALGNSPPVLAVPNIGSKNYFDLGFGYQFSDNFFASLNVNNLSDTDAPLMADAAIANNTDTAVYDVFGRSYQLSISMNF